MQPAAPEMAPPLAVVDEPPARFVAAPGSPSRMQRVLLREEERDLAFARRARVRQQTEVDATRRIAQGDECPFHSPEDTFSALVDAVQSVTDVRADAAMNLTTNPRHVFEWALAALVKYGDEQRAAGYAEAARELERPLSPETGAHVLDCCSLMWKALGGNGGARRE